MQITIPEPIYKTLVGSADPDFNCGKSITIEELAAFIVNRSLAELTPEAIKDGDFTPIYFDRDTGEPWKF